jgi:glyoxylase-like metal-dependent hydrolase (beta-lactamase superfamily II)
MAVFTLEAMQSEQGDCFILHFGDPSEPQFLLVDGGPGREVWHGRLKGRLAALSERFGTIELPLVVCSHIDDDHIGGVLALVQDVGMNAVTLAVTRQAYL